MRKKVDWSEAPTRLCRQEREISPPLVDDFGQETGRITILEGDESPSVDVDFGEDTGRLTVLEAPESLEARAYASVAVPERGAQHAQLPLPPSLQHVLSGGPTSAPRIPRLATPRPASSPYLRLATPRPEVASTTRRLTLTPLPVANPASIPVLPLAPITRQTPLAPARAHRPEVARYRFIGMVALTGLALGMALYYVVRAIL
jgi:hypothetical protein